MSVDLGEYDIAIIGLGVAGSNLAALLQSHLKVIAIDKKDAQGHCNDEYFHKPCGGLLSEGGQKAFAKQGLNLPHTILVKEQIFAINTIDWHYPYASYIQKAYINMERHRFDLWLKSLIPPHIHTFHKAYFKRIEQTSSGDYGIYFTQSVDSQNTSYHCRARFVVGADGAKSHIRRWLYPQLKTPSLVCIQEWFKESNPPMLSCIFDKELTPSYSWSMSKDEYFIFGGAYPHQQCQRAFTLQKQRLQSLGFVFGQPLKREACLVLQPTRWRDFVRGKNGVFLIGEAAGFVNASTLEGISGAMNSSRILSEILNTLQVNATSANPTSLHRTYAKRTRLLVCKTLFRAYVRYPFMFVPFLRRFILRFGILRVRCGLKNKHII
ncbi:FAD-binding protein [Helicobacter sp. MIT 21-1697]|uniref:FAD-binding protein n=1 Tax=Helicobacter sp. MIT 21-1697 TaxID=2993733 RepID=UPI00224B31F9|nr:FAD-binding protein [Helicobacter sp. MIT 21-1697]MCX2716744.1 FAD-binding protein [Helicobacter sp. MIT 21-1697]